MALNPGSSLWVRLRALVQELSLPGEFCLDEWRRGMPCWGRASSVIPFFIPRSWVQPLVVFLASPRCCPLSSHAHSTDSQFRMSILERLEQMEKRMAEIAAAGQAPGQGPEAPPIQVLLNKDHGLRQGTLDLHESGSSMTLLTHPSLVSQRSSLSCYHLVASPPTHIHSVARVAILGTLEA